jgi:hypothetical protein
MLILIFVIKSLAAVRLTLSHVAAKEYSANHFLVGGLTSIGNRTANSKALFYKFL